MPKAALEKEQCEQILEQQEFGFLSMSQDGCPYCLPFNFCYEQGCIYIHTGRKGIKWEFLADNPRVCFTVVAPGPKITGDSPCQYTYHFKSVVVRGKASEITCPDQARASLERLIDKYRVGAVTPVPGDKFEKVRMIRIDIDEMTGRKNF